MIQPISFGAMLRIQRPPKELWKKIGEYNYEKTGTYPEQPLYINPDQVTRIEPQIIKENVNGNKGSGTLLDILVSVSGATIHLSDGEEIKLDIPIEKVVNALHEARTKTDILYIDLVV